MPCAFIPYTSQSARINGGRNGWENEPEPCSTYLVGDEVLTHRQRHLNSVGFVGDGDGVEFKPVSAVHHACLVHRILKHLLVPLLAQHRADVHDFHLAATRSAGAGEQNQEHKEAHGGKNPKSSSGSAVWDQEKHRGHCSEVENPGCEVHAHCGGMHTVTGPTLRLRLRVSATRLELLCFIEATFITQRYSPSFHGPGFPAHPRHVISSLISCKNKIIV